MTRLTVGGLAALLLVAGTPAQFGEFMRSEQAKWGSAVREAGIKAD